MGKMKMGSSPLMCPKATLLSTSVKIEADTSSPFLFYLIPKFQCFSEGHNRLKIF
ncbi:hypothetical protein ACS0TY_011165 [Phlomoides rotata]